MKIFVIGGEARSGKSTFGNYLKEELKDYGYKPCVMQISNPLYSYAKNYFNYDPNKDPKPREFLQNTGDLMRAIDTNFLTKRILDDIKIYKELGIENVIISDVRLINEINYIKNSNYNVITIRVNSDKSNRVLTDSEKNHITETELDNYNDFDYIVDRNNIDNVIEEIVKGR